MSLTARLSCALFWVLSACGFGGTHPYAEDVYSACTRNELITNLKELKKSGRFNSRYGYPDGMKEQAPYYFYFSSPEINGTLLLTVNAGFEKKGAISLISFQDYGDGIKWQEWQGFNNGLDKQTQAKVTAWFEKNILPAATCK